MPPSLQQQQDRQANRRLAILRHAEEITGNVSQTCRYYGITRTRFCVWQRRYQEEGSTPLSGRRWASSPRLRGRLASRW
jgi:transposase-like protein